MKISKYLFLSVLICFCASALHAKGWKNDVNKLIVAGEFSKVEQVLDKLPAKQKRANQLQIDSIKSIMLRIRKDFSITPAQGKLLIESAMKRKVTATEIKDWKENKYIETRTIDGQEWWFRKMQRNFKLLNWEVFSNDFVAEETSTAATRQAWIDEAMKTKADKNNTRNWKKATVKMVLDVNANAIPAGETIRVWLPIPFENMRQRNFQMVSSSHKLTYSEGSKHHTVYMEAKAVADKPTHFEINYTYETGERHIDQAELLKKVKPYNTESEIYKTYTKQELPHMIVNDQMKYLAGKIVRNEKNPVLQASKIFDYITSNFPWAGAREYSTIENIPMYVLKERHGDCGQVALLYISLCRSIGIPTRWESGWCTNPGEVGWHDWAETYFEGIGWVNTDVSYGRSGYTDNQANYYKSGIDLYRLSTNEGISDALSPAKKYARSESVDFQAGEVEWKGGNLEYSDWDSELTIEVSPIK